MIIKGLQRHTLIDYPGKIACVVFTFGCNFRCGYCHNPELIVDDGRPEISQQEVLDFLKERVGFLDGVVISGGEPTLNGDLPNFISKIKQMGFSVKLDTNGTNPKMLKELMDRNLLDYIAMDIKGPLEDYDKIANVKVDIDKIKKSVDIVKNFRDYEFRTTAVPELFDTNIARKIGEWLDGSKRFYLQQFRGIKNLDKSFNGKSSFSKNDLEEFCKTMKPYFDECRIRGV